MTETPAPGTQSWIFRTATVLAVSLLAATIFAGVVSLLFDGQLRWFLLYYDLPIGIPFVAFLFDRAERYRSVSTASWALDLGVLVLAFTRAFVRVPFVSGHALFLSYCFLTTQSRVARLAAVLVLLEVIYLKIFVTHDTALYGGILLGCLVSLLYRQLRDN